MRTNIRRVAGTAVLAVALAAGPSAAWADRSDEEEAAVAAADLLLWRPLMLAKTALGVGLTAISLPITLATGDAEHAARELIEEPFKELTEKPLGEGSFIK